MQPGRMWNSLVRCRDMRQQLSRVERSNSISHLIGAVLALLGTLVLTIKGASSGDGWRLISFLIYGFTLCFLYLVSTLYHSLSGSLKTIFRTLDHQAIYLLIAGTYTPFTLVTLRASAGWWLFAAIWGLAAVGIALETRRHDGRRVVPIIIYVLMGWMIAFELDALLAVFPPAGFLWLQAGGALYMLGIVFYALGRWHAWAHVVWHLFVLAGSASHYFAILLYIA